MEILFEDDFLLVINKPPGLPVHATVDSKRDHVMAHFSNDFILIHRLDSLTSGTLLIAKTKEAALKLQKQLETHEIQKTYWAIVKGNPKEESGRLEHFLKEKKVKGKQLMEVVKSGGKKAILDYKVLKNFGAEALVEVKLITGRMHQIRVQMKEIGCPLKGDPLYSSDSPPLYLHARELVFIHPISKNEIKVTATEPKYFIV